MSVVDVGVRSGMREAGPNMVARDPAGGCEGVISLLKSISKSIDAGIGAVALAATVIGAAVTDADTGFGAIVGYEAGTGIGATVATVTDADTGIGAIVGYEAGTVIGATVAAVTVAEAVIGTFDGFDSTVIGATVAAVAVAAVVLGTFD